MQDPHAATMTPPTGLPVIPGAPPSWLVLEPKPNATPLARTHTRDVLGQDEPADDVEVVVSELVTNAVVHAPENYLVPVDVSPYIHMSLQVELRWILVGVRDPWPGGPRPIRVGDQCVHGRGLSIVDALTAAWWVEYRGVGKTVYALALRPGSALIPGELDRLHRP